MQFIKQSECQLQTGVVKMIYQLNALALSSLYCATEFFAYISGRNVPTRFAGRVLRRLECADPRSARVCIYSICVRNIAIPERHRSHDW